MEVELHSPGHGATLEDPTGGGWYCGAKLRQPKPEWLWCTNRAGFKTEHAKIGRCHLHGGRTESHNASATVTAARQACDRLGILIEIDPGEALLRAVKEAEGNLAFYRSLVEDLSYGEEPDDPEPGGPGRGILQPKMARSSGPDAETYVVEYVTHPLVVLYHEAERWRANVAATALKAGVEERRLRLQEADAKEFFDGIGEAIKAAELTPEQTEVFRSVLIARFRAVDGGGPAGSTAGEVPARSGPVGG